MQRYKIVGKLQRKREKKFISRTYPTIGRRHRGWRGSGKYETIFLRRKKIFKKIFDRKGEF
jgi:hypothetical protein